jgi:hypothetical protein
MLALMRKTEELSETNIFWGVGGGVWRYGFLVH